MKINYYNSKTCIKRVDVVPLSSPVYSLFIFIASQKFWLNPEVGEKNPRKCAMTYKRFLKNPDRIFLTSAIKFTKKESVTPLLSRPLPHPVTKMTSDFFPETPPLLRTSLPSQCHNPAPFSHQHSFFISIHFSFKVALALPFLCAGLIANNSRLGVC